MTDLHDWWPEGEVHEEPHNPPQFRWVVYPQTPDLDIHPVGMGPTKEAAIQEAMSHPDAGCWACGNAIASQEHNPIAHGRRECGGCGCH